jgi:hypothetical protein
MEFGIVTDSMQVVTVRQIDLGQGSISELRKQKRKAPVCDFL